MARQNWIAHLIIGILVLGVIVVGLAAAFFFFLPVIGIVLLGFIVYYVVRMVTRTGRKPSREGERVMKSRYTVLDDEKTPPKA